jgi:hypothetical protein
MESHLFLADVRFPVVGFKPQQLPVFRHIRAEEETVLGFLEPDVFESQLKSGDLAGVHVA